MLPSFPFFFFSTAVDNWTLSSHSDSHSSCHLRSCLPQPLPYIQVLAKYCSDPVKVLFCCVVFWVFQHYKKVTLHWSLRIINCLCFVNSGSTCKFVQSNFDYTAANALQIAQEFELQSQPVKQGKLPSPSTLWLIQSFTLLHAASLNFLNLKVSILQTNCRVHNRFLQSSC